MDLKSNSNKILGRCKYCKKRVYEDDDYPLRLDIWNGEDYRDDKQVNICHRKCEEKNK